MTSNIKAIVFDFGGVLLDWNPRNLYRRYFPDNPEAMEQFLAEINFMEWNAYQDKGRPFKEGVAILSNQYPQYSRLIQAYYETWEESVAGEIPGAVEILKRLKRKGFPLYGLSNWSVETFPAIRRKYSFFELFNDMVVSGYVNLIKPDPAIFKLLLKKIGRPARECLLIDDSDINVSIARELGFVTFQFQTPALLNTELNRLGVL
ncbi:MAG: HAD family phosphatase [Anaerolineales bacterium]